MSKIVDQYGRPVQGAALTYTHRELEIMIAREKGLYGQRAARPFAQVPTIYAIIQQISNGFAQVPYSIWRPVRSRSGQRGRRPGYEEVVGDAMLTRMRKPNRIESEYEFKEAWVTYLLTGGNVWLLTDDPDSTGAPRSLILLNKSHVKPIREAPFMPLLGWQVTIAGKPKNLAVDDLIHWKLPNDIDDVLGLAPHEALRAAVDLDYAQLLYAENFFKNSANPSGIMTHKDGALDPDQRKELIQWWEDQYAGPNKSGKIVLLPGEFEFKAWSVTQSENEHTKQRVHTREEIAAAYWGFPVQLLNSEENNGLSRADIDAARSVFYENVVIPLCRRFAEKINRYLVEPWKENYELAFDTDAVPAIRRTDLAAKVASMDIMVKSGIPVNVAVVALDMNISPVEGGDVGFLPGNYLPLTALVERQELPSPTKKKDDDKKKPVVEDDEEEDDEKAAVGIPTRQLRPVEIRATSKIKRVLYDLRRAALRDDRGLTAKLGIEWTRFLIPCMATAFLDGIEQARKALGSTDEPWLNCHSAQTVGEALASGQAQPSLIAFDNPLHNAELEAHVIRAQGVFDLLVDRVFGMAMEHRPRALASIDRSAEQLSRELLRWCQNAGAFQAAGDRFRQVESKTCSVVSEKCRYPGDSGIAFDMLHGCTCGVAVDGVEEEDVEDDQNARSTA